MAITPGRWGCFSLAHSRQPFELTRADMLHGGVGGCTKLFSDHHGRIQLIGSVGQRTVDSTSSNSGMHVLDQSSPSSSHGYDVHPQGDSSLLQQNKPQGMVRG
ncbi:hypothetical protein BHM03_00008561 [Ensete ventricosum]|nr:hypothetical protein BHM03_00008561 [Ensete ventricosum]